MHIQFVWNFVIQFELWQLNHDARVVYWGLLQVVLTVSPWLDVTPPVGGLHTMIHVPPVRCMVCSRLPRLIYSLDFTPRRGISHSQTPANCPPARNIILSCIMLLWSGITCRLWYFMLPWYIVQRFLSGYITFVLPWSVTYGLLFELWALSYQSLTGILVLCENAFSFHFISAGEIYNTQWDVKFTLLHSFCQPIYPLTFQFHSNDRTPSMLDTLMGIPLRRRDHCSIPMYQVSLNSPR